MTAGIILISLLVLFSAGVIAWQAIRTARHVTYVTLADGRRRILTGQTSLAEVMRVTSVA